MRKFSLYFSFIAAISLGLLLCARTSVAGPVTIFNNVNNSPNPVCCGYAVGLYPTTTNVFIDTFSFTVTGGNYLFDTASFLQSAGNTGTSAGFSVFLYSDSGGLPGSVLESWNGVPATPTIGLDTVTSTSSLMLQDGQQYWLGITTTDPAQTGIWWINPALATGASCDFFNGSLIPCANVAVGAFEITGTPTATPEPSSLLLLGTGLLGLGPFIRRRFARP